MNKQPLLILVICFILGIFFQDKYVLSSSRVIFVTFFSLILLLSVFINTYFFNRVKPFFIGLAFFGFGIILHSENQFSSNNKQSFGNETLVFKISKKLNSNAKNKKYEIVGKSGGKIFNAILFIPKSHSELDFRHYYKTKAFVSSVKAPEHDFQFNYLEYLRRKNIEFQCYANGEIVTALKPSLNFYETIQQKRLNVLQSINHSSLSSKSQEFLKGIILADRTEIDDATAKDFNKSGLMHFLTISGTHVVVIFGLIYFILMRFFPVKSRKIAIFISLLFIWLFALFIGFGNSVLRSCIMLTIYFVYILLQRKPDLLHSLALSAFIILMIDTQQIFDVGFQLSFLAVLGIFWFNQPLLQYFPIQDNYFKKILFNTITISISAQLATLPITLYYFHQFSIISIFANIFIVPFSEMIIIFSFLMTGLMAFNFDFNLVNTIYDGVITILLKAIHWFASWDYFFVEQIPFGILEVILLFLILYYLKIFIHKISFKNFYKVMICVFVFGIFRVLFSIFYTEKQEFLVHHYNKEIVVSLKKRNYVRFWVENNSNFSKIKKYLIEPYCVSRRVSTYDINVLPEKTTKIIFENKTYNLK